MVEFVFYGKAEESFLRQRSRVLWLAEGDNNSTFFHNNMRDRFNRNKILSLTLPDGTRIHETEQIHKEAVRHFQSILQEPPSDDLSYTLTDIDVTKRIPAKAVAGLVKPVTEEEIKAAMFSIHPSKAPGPDGFNAHFYRRTWHIIGHDVVKAILSFFQFGRILRELNHTSVSLIPKVQNPASLNEYRPISCCKVLYKVISKILANRLKGVLPSLIDPSQAAFVPGRHLSDNILIAQDLVWNYHRRDLSSWCTVKVDLQKAFDSLWWEFLLDLLHKMGFPCLFVDWIKSCIISPKFSININGEPVGFFSSTRGLRQGDPISSYLFVIAMEALSMLISKRVREQQSFAFHWRCNLTRMTHLSFADDLMLFCGDSEESASILKKALTDFSSASGLHLNASKSCVFIASPDERYKQVVLRIFGFPLGSLPIRYLGIPLITTRLTYGDCLPMIECITMQVKSWTTKFLSYAGRLQLIQSVLFRVQGFWTSLL